MEAPPKKKLVAKVTANIYNPNNLNGNNNYGNASPVNPNFISANLVRAKVSSSSVVRGTTGSVVSSGSSSVVSSGHSRNNSRTKTLNGQYDDFKGFSPISSPTVTSAGPATRASSTVGRANGSHTATLLSPAVSNNDSHPSMSDPGIPGSRLSLRAPAKRMTGTSSPLAQKFKAHGAFDTPPFGSASSLGEPNSRPSSRPTSPSKQAFSNLPNGLASSSPSPVVTPSPRARVVSSIRLQAPKLAIPKENGVVNGSSPASAASFTPGHKARTPSITSTSGLGIKSRPTTAKANPQQVLSPPRILEPTLMSQSPPSSVLSSRSSVSVPRSLSSHHSASTATDGESETNSDEEDSLHEPESLDTPQRELDEDALFAEEARSNRKIMDLEISNQSLLVVNTMLEATKLRQSREIKELRRKLREARHKPQPQISSGDIPMSPTSPEIRSGSGGSDDEDDEELEPEPDPAYDRICRMVEILLVEARQAIETTIDDHMPVSTNTVKVLSAAEVQQYERRRLGLSDDEEKEAEDKRDEDGDVSIDDIEASPLDEHPEPRNALSVVEVPRRQPTLFSSGTPANAPILRVPG